MTNAKSAMTNAKVALRAHWDVVATSEIYRNDFFCLRRDHCALTLTPEVTADHYVLEMPDAVIVVPVTASGALVMVEQYRHGADGEFLEFPGGQLEMVDERPELAAERELWEETGYHAAALRYLGAQYPNPGAQTNRIHTFLAEVCEGEARALDPFENLRVVVLRREQLLQRIAQGAKVPSATLAALSLLALAH